MSQLQLNKCMFCHTRSDWVCFSFVFFCCDGHHVVWLKVVCACAAGQDTHEGAVSVGDMRPSAVLRRRYLLAHEREEAYVVLSRVRPPCRVQQTHHWWVRFIAQLHLSIIQFNSVQWSVL